VSDASRRGGTRHLAALRIVAGEFSAARGKARAIVVDVVHATITISGSALLTAYCVAKYGVIGFIRALAEEPRAAKVSVNAICPGSVDARPDMSPDDTANTALFLTHATPQALTGACIDVYG
jgi:NAD(P)-dependent dehydrogenase (short-subunit alcohol dehydrogenase family)